MTHWAFKDYALGRLISDHLREIINCKLKTAILPSSVVKILFVNLGALCGYSGILKLTPTKNLYPELQKWLRPFFKKYPAFSDIDLKSPFVEESLTKTEKLIKPNQNSTYLNSSACQIQKTNRII